MWEYRVEDLAVGVTIGHALSIAVAIGVIINKKSRVRCDIYCSGSKYLS